MNIKVHASYIDSTYQPSFWGIIRGVFNDNPGDRFILKRLQNFVEMHELGSQIYCSSELVNGLTLFAPKLETQCLPCDFDALATILTEIPIWYVASDPALNHIFACKLSLDETGINKNDLEQFIIKDGYVSPLPNQYDLRHRGLSGDERLMLSLIGAEGCVYGSRIFC